MSFLSLPSVSRSRAIQGSLGWLCASGDDKPDGHKMLWLQCDAPPVDLQAAGDGEGTLPTFAGVAYTGGEMRPVGFTVPVHVDCSGAKVAGGDRPIHRDHDSQRIVGHSPAGQITISARQIKVSGVISGTGEDAREVRENGRNGFPWRLSIGARIERMEYVEPGQTAQCNSRSIKAGQLGAYIVRACTIFEISFVSLAGDDRTSVTVAASMEGKTMTYADWLKARGFDINQLTAQQHTTLRAQFDAEQNGGKPPTPHNQPPSQPAAGVQAGSGDGSPVPAAGGHPAAGPNQPPAAPSTVQAGGEVTPPTPAQAPNDLIAQQERDANERDAARLELRAAREEICARFNNPTMSVGEGDATREVPILVQATREGWTANETELHCRRNSRPTGVTAHTPSREVDGRALEASMCLSAGISEDECGNDYDERTMNAAMERGNRNCGLQQLFATGALRAGHSLSAGRFDDDTIRAALEAEQRGILQASSSTFSVSGILSNVVNKKMQAAYAATADVLSVITDWGPVSDFKEQKHYQLTVGGEWEEVGPDGELKHGTLVESEYTNAATTRGMMLALTRTHIRNDDLRAFLRIPAGIARKSANTKQKVGFKVLLDMVTGGDFNGTIGNLLTGASGALSIDGLQLAVNLFKKLKDEEGEPIAVTPAILLTGTTLSVIAEDLHTETQLATRLTSGNTKKILRNQHANKYEPHDSVFLDSEHGGTDTGYWLCAAKEDIPVLDGVALDGRMVPYIERSDAVFETLGIKWRAYDDWGVAKGNPRGAVHATGVA